MATTADDAVDPHRRLAGVRTLRDTRITAPLAAGCCLAAGAAYVAVADPSGRGGFLPCPFRSLTGWWCPGCGLTRATHHLLRGDVVQALRYNVFILIAVVAVIVTWARWMRRSLVEPAGASSAQRRLPAWVVGAAIGVAVTFAVVRNLPGVEVLRG